MAAVEKRIEQIETQSAEAALLARLAGERAARTCKGLLAEDLTALVNTLRAHQAGRAIAARTKNGNQHE